MLCDCVLIEAAVTRQEESADPAVISCCSNDKHHRHLPGKAFRAGKREKEGRSERKPGKTALGLVYQPMCRYGETRDFRKNSKR